MPGPWNSKRYERPAPPSKYYQGKEPKKYKKYINDTTYIITDDKGNMYGAGSDPVSSSSVPIQEAPNKKESWDYLANKMYEAGGEMPSSDQLYNLVNSPVDQELPLKKAQAASGSSMTQAELLRMMGGGLPTKRSPQSVADNSQWFRLAPGSEADRIMSTYNKRVLDLPRAAEDFVIRAYPGVKK